MRHWPRILGAVKTAVFTMVVWLAVHGPALAQAGKKGQEPEVGSGVFVFAYFVVILGIAAGLLGVCLSSRRRDRARPEQYGEAKTAVKE